jgi:hypothetical protein
LKDPHCLRASEFRDPDAMLPWIRVLSMESPQVGESTSFKLAPGAAAVPADLVPRDTGLRLSDWPGEFLAWSTEDRAAFQTFLNERVPAFVAGLRANVLEMLEQRRIDFRAMVEAEWTKAGIHPSQELGWEKLPADVCLDIYDALAALGQAMHVFHAHGAAAQLRTPHAVSAYQHARAVWGTALGGMRWLPESIDPLMSTSDVAAGLRGAGDLDELPAQSQDWWQSQLVAECELLYDASEVESVLMPAAPMAWEVICTVASRRSLGGL